MFQFLSERLESLQTLKIGWMDAGNYTQTKFKSLTELSIDGCSMTDEDWTLFLAQNPQIEKLSLDNFLVDSYSVEAIIKNGANLKHLQMNSGFYPTDLLQTLLEHKKLMSVTLRPETMEHFEDELAKEHNIDFKTGREDRLSFYHNKYEYFENVCEENPELWNNFDEHYRELH